MSFKYMMWIFIDSNVQILRVQQVARQKMRLIPKMIV